MNRATAKSTPWKTASHDVLAGSKTASVFPSAPPWAITATAMTRNGTTETPAVMTIARTPTRTPNQLIAITAASAASAQNHHPSPIESSLASSASVEEAERDEPAAGAEEQQPHHVHAGAHGPERRDARRAPGTRRPRPSR